MNNELKVAILGLGIGVTALTCLNEKASSNISIENANINKHGIISLKIEVLENVSDDLAIPSQEMYSVSDELLSGITGCCPVYTNCSSCGGC